MVTVNFKLTDCDPIHLQVNSPEKFEHILQRCATQGKIQVDGIIAIRENRVLKAGDLVRDLDVIDVYPALSGG